MVMRAWPSRRQQRFSKRAESDKGAMASEQSQQQVVWAVWEDGEEGRRDERFTYLGMNDPDGRQIGIGVPGYKQCVAWPAL